MRVFNFKNSMSAWEGINEMFIRNPPRLKAYYKGKALYAHHIGINIEEPIMDPEFNFGRYFNYTKNKWQSLQSNYIDYNSLNSLKEQIATKKEYNFGYQFKNNHGHGKGCLLSATITRTPKDIPRITLFARACEVTKRLSMDLLLIQRVGEYLFEGSKFRVTILFNQMFNDDLVLLMYQAHKDIREILSSGKHIKPRLAKRREELLPRLELAFSTDPEKVKYKVHRRVIKVLRPDLVNYPRLLAKDCKLIF